MYLQTVSTQPIYHDYAAWMRPTIRPSVVQALCQAAGRLPVRLVIDEESPAAAPPAIEVLLTSDTITTWKVKPL